MEHVICLGFAKCGTTLLHEIFSSTPGFEVPFTEKEIKYFTGNEISLDGYRKHFDEKLNSDSVLFEASPQYVTGLAINQIKKTLHNIKSVIPDAQLIFCIRHPIYRAYSHYVHDVQNFARYGSERHRFIKDHPMNLLKTPYVHSFEYELENSTKIHLSYVKPIQLALENFPPRKIKFFFLEDHVKSFSTFFKELTRDFSFIDSNFWNNKKVPLVLGRKEFPAYLCKGIDTPTERLNLADNELLVASHKGYFKLDNIAKETAKRISNSQDMWTKSVTADQFSDYFDRYFRNDMEILTQVLNERGIDSSMAESYLDFEYKPVNLDTITPDPEKADICDSFPGLIPSG